MSKTSSEIKTFVFLYIEKVRMKLISVETEYYEL